MIRSSRNVSILDRNILKQRSDQVSLSAFSYIYSELLQYHQSRSSNLSELEQKLSNAGYRVGFKVLELLAYRSRENKRETRIMSILQFISSTAWKCLFGKPADSLERSIDHTDEYMIFDYNPATSIYVSAHQTAADAYISGIIAGILEGAGFTAKVSAHTVQLEDAEIRKPSLGIPTKKDKAVFLVKFSPQILERDTALER